MSDLKFTRLEVTKKYRDERGFFTELYKKTSDNGFPYQINMSVSKKGVIRGLHFQVEPFAQDKIVRCLSGKIEDVAVDIRPDSPTYGQWDSVILSNPTQVFHIPEWCAHGFKVLSRKATVLYLTSDIYDKESERGFLYTHVWNEDSIASEKDKLYPKLMA